MLKNSTLYEVIVYDLENIDNIVNIILNRYSRTLYAYCLHDKDFKEDTGELKKVHIHLLLKFPQQVNYNTIIKECADNGITLGVNQFANVNNYNSAIRYLIHYDNKDKFQYEKSSIINNLSNIDKFFNGGFCCNKNDDSDKLLLAFMQQCIKDNMNWYEFIQACINEGFFATLRKGGNLYKDLYKGLLYSKEE